VTLDDDRNDHELVAAAQKGDPAAFETLVRRHQRRALAVALGILRNREDARDACQDAFLRAFRAIDSFDGEAQLGTWLHRIVVNVCIDRLRRATPGVVALDDVAGLLAGDDDPERAADGAELGVRIRAALSQLGPKHRTALVLREVQGLSYRQIAAATKTSLGTVMSRLFHARKKMQALLASDGDRAPSVAFRLDAPKTPWMAGALGTG
jgi:RNA polymerase sigma-70 factor (ECF subfamily)